MRSIFFLTVIAVTLLQMLWAGPAFAQTATGPMPSETTEARRYIQNGMADIYTKTSDNAFPGLAKADIGRAKACVVQALMADIPDDVAEELVVQLKGSSSARDPKFVLHWLMPKSTDVARQNQLDARMAEICPELSQRQKTP